MQLIAKGAEASLFREKNILIKKRLKKSYRIKELDNQLRKSRTKHEAKILEKAHSIISVPKLLKTDLKNFSLEMEFLSGKLMKEFFDKEGSGGVAKVSKTIGHSISKLHQKNLIHNDLTTSNLLLSGKKIYFIDFGLAFHSTRIEDKAMDLVVLKKALMASHPKKFPLIWKNILKGYKPTKEIINRVEKIEKRVRYT